MDKNVLRISGNEFVTRISNAQLTMLIEALDYADEQIYSSDIQVFDAIPDTMDAIDEVQSLRQLLTNAQNYADKGTIIVEY